jgi:hypothetical protein
MITSGVGWGISRSGQDSQAASRVVSALAGLFLVAAFVTLLATASWPLTYLGSVRGGCRTASARLSGRWPRLASGLRGAVRRHIGLQYVGSKVREHLFEHLVERREFRFGETGKDLGKLAVSIGSPSTAQFHAARGERNEASTAIRWMWCAEDEAGRFEHVDQAGHVARRAAQHVAQLALGERAIAVEQPDDLRPDRGESILSETTVHRVVEYDGQLEQPVHDVLGLDWHSRPLKW